MKLRIFTDDGMLLSCHFFIRANRYKATNIKKNIRQTLKIEKLSQKWLFVRQDEDYLYYEDKGTKYKFNKVYWRK